MSFSTTKSNKGGQTLALLFLQKYAKKIIFLIPLLLIVTPIEGQNLPQSITESSSFNWEGKWRAPQNEHSSFLIQLDRVNGNLKGWHCYTSATKIDCAEDNEITLSDFQVINSLIVEGKFKTSYSNIGTEQQKTEKVQLKIIDNNTVQWWLKERPSAVPPTPISSKKIQLVRVN